MKTPCHRIAAFTLVEVLVVIGVIGVLLGLIVPAIGSVKAESRSAACLSNLRQLYTAIQSYRAQTNDLLPYAEPLPAATPFGPIGGLPEALKSIIDRKAETWFCPGDTDEETVEIGTSYIYVAGAFMLAEIDPTLSPSQNALRSARLVSQRFESGFLTNMPLLSDSGDYHAHGNRQPWNGVFIGGEARVLKPSDGDIDGP